MTEYLILEPRTQIDGTMVPCEPTDGGKTLVVMPNHLGASTMRDMNLKGQEVADVTRHRTVVYDRFGTGASAGHSGHIRPRDYPTMAARTGTFLAGVLDVEGATLAHLAGQSAAATEVAAITRTNTMPVGWLTCMDSVGVWARSAPGNLFAFLAHQVDENRHGRPLESCRVRADGSVVEELSAAERLRHLALQAGRAAREIAAYRDVYGGAITRENLLYVARFMPYVTGNVVMVGHSFTSPLHAVPELARAFRHAREIASAADKARFDVTVLPADYHSKFDALDTYAEQVQNTFALEKQVTA